jgi:hypothetical protein
MRPRFIITVIFFSLHRRPFDFQVDVQQVCFSPNAKCTDAIVERIDNAK